jgi:fatty-acyl-CoA synthase
VIPPTISAMFRARAAEHPARTALRLHRGGEAPAVWDYRTLEGEMRRAAAALERRGIRAGDRVMILAPEIEEAVRALAGCWGAGATPVAVGLPHRMGDARAFVERLAATARRVEARALVVGSNVLGGAEVEMGSDGPTPIAAAALAAEEGRAEDPPEDPEACAILQLSSGTTGRPKGVVLPHRAVLANLEQMRRAFGTSGDDVGVSWLPVHHDMGLIGGFLLAVYSGLSGVTLLSQSAFFAQPMIWLRTIAETRATISPGPTAAYALCVQLAARAKRAGLDLSSWDRALVGAEPVLPDVLDGFAAAYAPLGFRARAFVPVYGLAEATLAVAATPIGAGPTIDRVRRVRFERDGEAAPAGEGEEARAFVASGAPVHGTEVRIVRDGFAVGERAVGAIEVRAPSLMVGYLGDAERTGEAMPEGSGGWLRTGDLGYFAEGKLYVTGRAKELIIRAGRNLDPVEVEEIASEVPGVKTGAVIACGLQHPTRGTEQAVVVAESRREAEEHPALEVAIKAALRERGLEVDVVKIVPVGWLPWTTSGKRMRTAVRERLLGGELGAL